MENDQEAEERERLLRSRTWAEVDLDALRHNVAEARRILRPGVKIAAVLKADAYGLGAETAAKTLLSCGVEMLAVACLSEGLFLKKRFPEAAVLVMGYTADECLSVAVKHGVTVTLFSAAQAALLSRAAAAQNRRAKFHLKIDTGFNRLGLKPGPETDAEIRKICSFPMLDTEGIFSHLSLDSREQDEKQFALFMETVARAEAAGIRFPLRHICDSIGMVRYPAFQLDLVRPGAFLYGMTSDSNIGAPVRLLCPLTLKTRLARVARLRKGEAVGYDRAFVAGRDCLVGTLCAGYADGYPRSLSGKGEVLLRGKRAPVVGLVCMDQCMVDLTDIPEAAVGDEAVLLGGNGAGAVPVKDAARAAGTNKNELLCRVGGRVPRIYRSGGKTVGVRDFCGSERSDS